MSKDADAKQPGRGWRQGWAVVGTLLDSLAPAVALSAVREIWPASHIALFGQTFFPFGNLKEINVYPVGQKLQSCLKWLIPVSNSKKGTSLNCGSHWDQGRQSQDQGRSTEGSGEGCYFCQHVFIWFRQPQVHAGLAYSLLFRWYQMLKRKILKFWALGPIVPKRFTYGMTRLNSFSLSRQGLSTVLGSHWFD